MLNKRFGSIALAVLAMSGCAYPKGGRSAGDVVYLDQGWGAQERQIFYRASQGTRLIPLAWFVALEREDSAERFAASDYVTRYQFIADPASQDNPDRLPVGFAKDVDPATQETYLGFTCGTCHTRQLSFRGTRIRIDGGPAIVDLVAFTDAVFKALAVTRSSPEKFDRFARAVLKEKYGPSAARVLGERVKQTLEVVQLQSSGGGATVAGYGRLDALDRAGNLLLGPLDTKNLRATNAPVDYPHLWDTPSYDWVQWNGSIAQPMGRNIGEALGVGTHTTFTKDTDTHVRSSIRVDNLHLLEQQVIKLRAPRWPERLFGRIDRLRAARGKQVYMARCAGCHEPRLAPPNDYGKRFLTATMSSLDVIGTDPTDAANLHDRVADLGALGLGALPAVQALQQATSAISQAKYKEYGLSPEQRAEWDGYRSNEWRAPLAYKARSLDGIWAAAPYLHNGSVPNLYELLLPVDQRSKRFYLGNPEFDPRRVGLRADPFEGGFELVTDVTGNSNAGHEYRDGPGGKGVLGPALTEEERWDVIEYLKTL